MRYEPTGYIYEYEISALVFLIIIATRYFSVRRFPNKKDKLFSAILWIVMTDLAADVITSIIIDNVFAVPLTVTYAANGLFYMLQISLPVIMTLYTLALAESLNKQTIKRIWPTFIPGAAAALLLLSNVHTHWFFYVDPQLGYVHGKMFIYTYFAAAFYILLTFIFASFFKARLRRIEYLTILRFLAIVLTAMAIQYMYPALLISGVAMALAVTMMYFTLQNPETMLDATTGAFTAEAMLAFLRDRQLEHERVQLVGVKINNMSRINELLGIENGSRLLRTVSEFMRQSAGEPWVFRMRGGSFVAITRSRENYTALCRQVDGSMSRPWMIGSTEIMLQATVCYADMGELVNEPVAPQDAVSILEAAFMEKAVGGSRIRTVAVGADFLEKMKRNRAVEAALREAVETGVGLEPYFQPLWSVKEERFTNAEVLLRFNHPVLGAVSPGEFVPIAESCGLVTAMDELVVRKVCEFIHNERTLGTLGLDAVEINLSAMEFMHRRLPEMLSGIMKEYEVEPAFLCFEITETAATESFELLGECMQTLSRAGCKFALDDFGTGYANISQVIQLPFSMVKLDRSLLFGSDIVLEDMARMFTRMGRVTVIEGVETAEQAERAKTLNVDYIQGYFYARPMNGRDFISFLGRQSFGGEPDGDRGAG